MYQRLLEEIGRVSPEAYEWLTDALNIDEYDIGPARNLGGCMIWHLTPQGWGYWHDIAEQLPMGMQ